MLYCCDNINAGTADGQLITEYTWDEMGLQKQSKDPEVVEVEASSAEATPSSKEDNKLSSLRKRIYPAVCCNICMKISFVMLGIVAILLAFAMITITVLTSIATKAYDTHQSSRLVAMVLLAVTAAISACIIISAEVAVFKKHVKPIHAAGIVLLVLAVIQAMIAGISVKVTASDELNLGKSLADSFKLSRTDNPRHVKLWGTTQFDLNCCGVYGPEDYRSKNLPYYFPPDVPVSCCPAYDPDRSDLVQEKERETCKAKKSFYDTGCKDLVLIVFKETSSMVLGVTLTLIIVELLLMIFGALLCKQMNKKPKGSVEVEH